MELEEDPLPFTGAMLFFFFFSASYSWRNIIQPQVDSSCQGPDSGRSSRLPTGSSELITQLWAGPGGPDFN